MVTLHARPHQHPQADQRQRHRHRREDAERDMGVAPAHRLVAEGQVLHRGDDSALAVQAERQRVAATGTAGGRFARALPDRFDLGGQCVGHRCP